MTWQDVRLQARGRTAPPVDGSCVPRGSERQEQVIGMRTVRSQDHRRPGATAVLAVAVLAVLAVFGGLRIPGRAPVAWASGRYGARPGAERRGLPRATRAVGIAANPANGGYWILKSTGGVDNFHAPWHGSLAGRLRPGTAATAIAAGRPGGYLILTSDGAVHAYGTPFHGSDEGRLPRGVSAVGIAANQATGGYRILRSDGGVDGFGASRHALCSGGCRPEPWCPASLPYARAATWS